MSRAIARFILGQALMLALCAVVFGQQRPLITEDVDIIKPGVVRIESGFEFLQNQTFPLSGLHGDVTKLVDTRLSFGLAPNVEFQIEWTLQNFLSITRRTPSPIDLKLGANAADTNDV